MSVPEDRIIDFSHAGYQASEEPIPFVRVVETLEPLPGEAGSTDGPYAADEENNLKNGIQVLNAENAWVRGCRMLHTSRSAVLMTDSRYVTVRDCKLLEPVPVLREGRPAFYSNNDSSMILVYNCIDEEGRQDFVTVDGHLQSADPSAEPASLFERQLEERIGERQAYRVLAQTLSKASLNTEILFPRPVVDGVIQGEVTPAQTAFEEADRRSWKTVMSDDGTGDWTDQWFLDGEGTTTVTNSPEGMELKALDSHMVLWTNESFDGDIKIE